MVDLNDCERKPIRQTRYRALPVAWTWELSISAADAVLVRIQSKRNKTIRHIEPSDTELEDSGSDMEVDEPGPVKPDADKSRF